MRRAAVCVALLVIACAGGVSAKVTWQRGPYMETYGLDRPWESKGLTRVTMKPRPGVAEAVLCDKGRATLPLVTPARGKPNSAYYRQVAASLKKYLDAATGASFKVVGDNTNPKRGIFIGPCERAGLKPFIAQAAKLEPEHFLVSAFADGVVLIGRDVDTRDHRGNMGLSMMSRFDARGTYFAACDFLERFVGVRFYLPGDLGTFIPYLNNRTVVEPPVGYTDGPVFEMRLASTGNYLTKDHKLLGYTKREGVLWMIALRNADYYRWKSGHSDNYWHEFYAKDHPEWFAMRADGSRMVGKRGQHSSQRCYSNEEAFQEHLRAIDRYYKTGEGRRKFANTPPNEKYIYWWPNDGYRGCECNGCLALTDKDGPHNMRLRRLIWGYTAKLARAAQKRWPGKTVIGSFYSGWSGGPGDIKLPGNVSFMVMQTWTAYLKEPAYWDSVTKALEAKMALVRSPVAIWEHYTHRPRIANRMDAPYLVPHYLQKYVRYLRGKSSGVYLNGHQTGNFALDGYANYLYKKLLWNPDMDVDAALEEYCRLMFGPASPQALQYYRTVIDRWENVRWQNLSEDELQRPHGGLKWTRYYKDTYPRDVRMKLKSVLAQGLACTTKGTAYHARTDYLVKGVAPFFSQGEFLDQGSVKTAECARLTPKIDGTLDEWKGVSPLTMKNNVNGADVTAWTEVYTAYDSTTFYMAVRAHEPDAIEALPAGGAAMRDKLKLWRHDSVEMFLCTEQPGLKEAMLNLADQYHQFIIDPNGNLFDGYKSINAKGLDATKNIPIKYVARKGKDGYVIEAAIPFAALNAVPPKPGSHWIVNFFRNRPRKGQGEPIHAWSPTLASAHDRSRYGKLVFPSKTVWRSDFTNPKALKQKVWAYRKDTKVTRKVVDGRLVVHVKTGDLGGATYTDVRIDCHTQPSRVLLKKPVKFEWRFRGEGKAGHLYIVARASADGPRAVHLRTITHKARRLLGTGWNVATADKPLLSKGGKPNVTELPSLAHCIVTLRIGPKSDFTFEIDYFKLMERE